MQQPLVKFIFINIMAAISVACFNVFMLLHGCVYGYKVFFLLNIIRDVMMMASHTLKDMHTCMIKIKAKPSSAVHTAMPTQKDWLPVHHSGAMSVFKQILLSYSYPTESYTKSNLNVKHAWTVGIS